MPNTNPIFTKTPSSAWAKVTTANINKDGTGSVETIFTAGAEGSKVERIIAEALGTNVASALRIFMNNGLDPSTPANNTLIKQMGLPASTITEIDGQIPIMVALDLVLPAGYKLNVTIGTTVAAGWQVTALGGDY